MPREGLALHAFNTPSAKHTAFSCKAILVLTMGPKYFVLSACCLLALALALGSQRQVVFARDVPTHTSTGVHGRGKQIPSSMIYATASFVWLKSYSKKYS